MWAIRIVHEASLHESVNGNSFVTLTYRNPHECSIEQLEKGFHIPEDWSLHKKHFQDFMKRLRKRFPQKLRYFMCGEYGATCRHGIDLNDHECVFCNVGRPHYHAIIFNCTFPDLEKYTQVKGEDRYTSPMLESVWKYGFVDVGEVNLTSAAYVARYALKKITGVQADDWYLDRENGDYKAPEFSLMSRGGKGGKGIAYEWFQKYKNDVFPRDAVPVQDGEPIRGIPRYYEELFKEENALSMEEIKERRQEFLAEHAEEYTPERLMSRYKCTKARLELFQKRNAL
jgi:hypothetical protein